MAKRIDVSDLDIFYGSFKAVENVSLSVEPRSVTAFIGVILALTIGGEAEHFSAYVLPVAAGCFIYLAAGGLIPRFLQSTNLKGSFIHIALMSVGVAAMLALTFLE